MLEEPLLHEIAQDHGISPGQVCLAWVLSKDVALVTKTKSPERLKENLEAVHVQLATQEIEAIDKLTKTNQRLFLDPYRFH